MYIDTHTHLDFESYNEDREKVIQRALANNVAAIITIGTDVKSSLEAVSIAENYAPVFAAVGIHPTDCAETGEKDLNTIAELATHEKVVAIGEVGLDYYHMRAEKSQQKEIFKAQISLAKKLNKPLIIHNREAHDDMYQCIIKNRVGEIGAVMHSFSGDTAFLEKILLANLFISYTGNITFKRTHPRAS